MRVSRATVGLVGLLSSAAGCRQPIRSDAGSAPSTSARIDAGLPTTPAAAAGPVAPAGRIERALADGFVDAPMAPGEFDRWMAELGPGDSDAVRQAWLFTAVRRAPADRLGRIWSAALPADEPTLIRALAGRDRAAGAVDLPPTIRAVSAPPTLDLATAIARLRPAVAYSERQDARLVAASLEDQLAAARLLSVPSIPWPDSTVTDLASPAVWPALIRSLSARPGVPDATWIAVLSTSAAWCRTAPRQWCNAWRAARDGAPRSPAIDEALRAAVQIANLAAPLPPGVASALRCENAASVDRLGGLPGETLRCSLPGFEWLGAVAQATVWASSGAAPRVRASALEAIRSGARGQAQVLEAVAAAAVQLPARSAQPLLVEFASERDPGVLAALLEGLVLHVQHARLLPAPTRVALERAPFGLPEGPSLEARQHALAMARLLGDPSPGDPGSTGALRQAWQPDAGVAPVTVAPRIRTRIETRPIEVRIVTDIGQIRLSLEPSQAPAAVAGAVAAVRAHRYDGLAIHRVVPGFVVQGLDPRGDGYGGTDQPVRTELSRRPFERGTVGIPLAGLDTGGIQLFVVTADAPHLDGRYPWVGRVTHGMDVIDGLLPQDRVVRVELVEEDE